MMVMGTDNKGANQVTTTATNTTEVRDWTVVVRKRTANRFQPTIFRGTWEEAHRLADALAILTDLEVWYMHEDDTEVFTHTGRFVAIKGEPVAIEELLEPCGHHIDSIEGYKVRIAGTAPNTSTVIFYRAHEYGLAQAKATDALERGRAARVSRLYSCGHWSEDLDRYYTERSAS